MKRKVLLGILGGLLLTTSLIQIGLHALGHTDPVKQQMEQAQSTRNWESDWKFQEEQEWNMDSYMWRMNHPDTSNSLNPYQGSPPW